MIPFYENIIAPVQEVQQPESNDLAVALEEIPRKRSIWQQLVDIINFIGAVVTAFLHPQEELDCIHRSIKAL